MYTCAMNNDVYNVYRFSCLFYGITVSISVRAVGAIHVDKDNFMAGFHLANVRKSNHLSSSAHIVVRFKPLPSF